MNNTEGSSKPKTN